MIMKMWQICSRGSKNVLLSARSVETCDMFISLASCLVRHANATSILLGTPSCSKFCAKPNMHSSLEYVLPAIGISRSEQIIHFLGCTTLVFQYIMVQGHSGNVLIQTFKKVNILVKNVPSSCATPAIWSLSMWPIDMKKFWLYRKRCVCLKVK